MHARAKARVRWLGIAVGVSVLVVSAFAAGRSASSGVMASGGMEQVASSGYAGTAVRDGAAGQEHAVAPTMDSAIAPEASADAAKAEAGGERMVIRNAGISLRVEDVEVAIDKIRSTAARFDAEVADLYLDSGNGGEVPLDATVRGPSSAQVTVRVPADDLDRLVAEIDGLGTVLSENSSASDVTEQHIDLEARLKNLRAEEARLREFLQRAGDVKDLLAVQAELSRVRGEIEAMTAQMTYLERQVARATLSITLIEPGPIVSPNGTDWGFRRAVTDGLRAAVAILTTTITALIAIAPLLLLAALVWFAVRAIATRRAVRSGANERMATAGEDNDPDAVEGR